MIRSLITAYGSGRRAGKISRPLIVHQDGTKTVALPINPFCRKSRFLHWFLYEEGVARESKTSLSIWLKSRRA